MPNYSTIYSYKIQEKYIYHLLLSKQVESGAGAGLMSMLFSRRQLSRVSSIMIC
jgi:hypothetical protein